jgi:hypothetical protein
VFGDRERWYWLMVSLFCFGLVALGSNIEWEDWGSSPRVEGPRSKRGAKAKARKKSKKDKKPSEDKSSAPEGQEVGKKAAEEELPPGRWKKLDQDLTDEQREIIAELEALGYVGGSYKVEPAETITVHQKDKVAGGLNFYASGHAAETVLMDMEGRALHRWGYDFWEVWPKYPVRRGANGTDHFRRAYLYENGDVLGIYEGKGIIKLDRDSNLLWAKKCHAHHDLEVMPNGDIYVLAREARLVPRVNPDKPILEDFVLVLGADGEEKRRVSLLEAFERADLPEIWPGARDEMSILDIFHTNTLEVLDGSHTDELPMFKKGHVLTSMRTTSFIGVVDLDSSTTVWAKLGQWKKQHDPKMLGNGNMLIFDNIGLGKHSRVTELNPVTMEVVWEYSGSKKQPFFSRYLGTAQRLNNGNTLITEGEKGRAFEVTGDKEIVWEFFNPHRAGEEGEFIGALYEVVRLDEDFPTDWIQ